MFADHDIVQTNLLTSAVQFTAKFETLKNLWNRSTDHALLEKASVLGADNTVAHDSDLVWEADHIYCLYASQRCTYQVAYQEPGSDTKVDLKKTIAVESRNDMIFQLFFRPSTKVAKYYISLLDLETEQVLIRFRLKIPIPAKKFNKAQKNSASVPTATLYQREEPKNNTIINTESNAGDFSSLQQVEPKMFLDVLNPENPNTRTIDQPTDENIVEGTGQQSERFMIAKQPKKRSYIDDENEVQLGIEHRLRPNNMNGIDSNDDTTYQTLTLEATSAKEHYELSSNNASSSLTRDYLETLSQGIHTNKKQRTILGASNERREISRMSVSTSHRGTWPKPCAVFFDFPAKIAPDMSIDPTTQLEAIRNKFEKKNVVFINGVSGMGKTTLASEYAYRYQEFYEYAVCIKCHSENRIKNSFKRLSKWLGFNTSDGDDPNDIISQVLDRLRDEKCLIVYDNCNSLEMIDLIWREYFPSNLIGDVILTTVLPQNWCLFAEKDAELYSIQQYEQSKILQYIRSVLGLKYTDFEAATEIINYYSGFTLLMTLITKFILRYSTLKEFTIKHKESFLSQSDLNVNKEQFPLLAVLSSLDKKCKTFLYILSLVREGVNVPAEFFYESEYFVASDSVTKYSDLKYLVAPLVNMSLITIDESSSSKFISIGHDIILNYLQQSIDSGLQEIIDNWASIIRSTNANRQFFVRIWITCKFFSSMAGLVQKINKKSTTEMYLDTIVESTALYMSESIKEKFVAKLENFLQSFPRQVFLIRGIKQLSPDDLRKAHAMCLQSLGPDHLHTLFALRYLAECTKNEQDRIDMFAECYQKLALLVDQTHAFIICLKVDYGTALLKINNHKLAARLLNEVVVVFDADGVGNWKVMMEKITEACYSFVCHQFSLGVFDSAYEHILARYHASPILYNENRYKKETLALLMMCHLKLHQDSKMPQLLVRERNDQETECDSYSEEELISWIEGMGVNEMNRKKEEGSFTLFDHSFAFRHSMVGGFFSLLRSFGSRKRSDYYIVSLPNVATIAYWRINCLAGKPLFSQRRTFVYIKRE